MKVVLSVSKKEADLILTGKQKAIIKPSLSFLLERGDTIFLYQTKTNQTIVGQCEVTFCDLVSLPTFPREIVPSFTLRDQMEFEKRGIHFVYLIRITNPRRYLNPETFPLFKNNAEPRKFPIRLDK